MVSLIPVHFEKNFVNPMVNFEFGFIKLLANLFRNWMVDQRWPPLIGFETISCFHFKILERL